MALAGFVVAVRVGVIIEMATIKFNAGLCMYYVCKPSFYQVNAGLLYVCKPVFLANIWLLNAKNGGTECQARGRTWTCKHSHLQLVQGFLSSVTEGSQSACLGTTR
ncbi:hypothetical protein HDV62DRAFT_61078 [Trichoderma sp. SZMC 28011]